MLCAGARYFMPVFVVFTFIQPLRSQLDLNPANYEFVLTATSIDYINPAFMGPGTYVRVFRKKRGGAPGFYAFFPLLQDYPIKEPTTYVVLQKLSNKWRETFFKIERSFCDLIAGTSKIEKKFMSTTNFPKQCPVTKGNYTITNFVVLGKDLPVMIPQAELRVRIIWGPLMTYNIDLKVEQKRVGGPPKNHH